MEADDVFHHRGSGFLQRDFPRLGLRPKSRPAGCERHARHRQPQQSPANLATRHLHAARAPLNKSPKHSRRMAGNAARSALTNGLPEVLWKSSFTSTRARSLERVEIQPLKP